MAGGIATTSNNGAFRSPPNTVITAVSNTTVVAVGVKLAVRGIVPQ
jgi:hypothetical protein